MKGRGETPKPVRREIFVLTPEEKRIICFVLVAFVLGLATKYYRDNHPAAAAKPTIAARGRATPATSPISRP